MFWAPHTNQWFWSLGPLQHTLGVVLQGLLVQSRGKQIRIRRHMLSDVAFGSVFVYTVLRRGCYLSGSSFSTPHRYTCTKTCIHIHIKWHLGFHEIWETLCVSYNMYDQACAKKKYIYYIYIYIYVYCVVFGFSYRGCALT
jgi:hypothetical protein